MGRWVQERTELQRVQTPDTAEPHRLLMKQDDQPHTLPQPFGISRRFLRAAFAKSGDFLPPLDFVSLLIAGFASLPPLATRALPETLESPGSGGFRVLIWLSACIAPFMLYDSGFTRNACAGRWAVLSRSFARRFVMFAGLVWTISLAGRWLDDMPLSWSFIWCSAAVVATTASRLLLGSYLWKLTREGRLAEAVAVVGAAPPPRDLISRIRQNALLYGVFDDQARTSGSPVSSIDELLERARHGQPDRILITLPIGATDRLQAIMARLRPLGVPVELCPQDVNMRLQARTVGHLGDGLSVMLLADRPIKHWNAVLKSVEDFVLVLILITMLLPLLACIALAIRLDSPGPVFFRQRRHGLNNGEFDIYKFRTMYSTPREQGSPLQQTVRGDARITRVGRFLRKWSLDELPQIFNVAEGSMSLVGPRPHALDMRTEHQLGPQLTRFYAHRHRVKPGITGWSQINGLRGATDTAAQLRRRIEFDLHYIENWSLLFDLKILFLTFREVLRGTNAY